MARRRRTALGQAPIDQRTVGEGISFPGIDPRQWISYGVVDDEAVTFDEELGPLLAVTLQPSGYQVTCRLAYGTAGNGEGEYHPFVPGDEVLVAIPEGDERAGCVVFGRLNNGIDKFPDKSVAGQDPTTNTFGFRRMRTPWVEEIAGPWLLRQATTGALVSLDTKGTLTLKDGQKAALQMTPDLFGYQSGDAKFLLQLDLTGKRFTLQVDDAVLTISGSKASPAKSALAIPGTFAITTSGNPAAEHVATIEAIANVLAQLLGTISPLITSGLAPLVTPAAGAPIGPAIATPIVAALTPAQLATAITAAASAPANPAVAAAIFGAFSGAQQKPPGVPGQGQLKPGIGCAGLLAG